MPMPLLRTFICHETQSSHAPSLDDLLDLAKIDFAPLYEQIAGKPDIAPDQLLTEDVLFNRGTGRYHAHKRGIPREEK